MELEYAERGSGKTTKCVLYAISHNCILVVGSEAVKELIEKKWKEAITVGALTVKTIDEYVRYRAAFGHKPIVMDNAEYCLEILLDAPIKMMSIDKENN